MAPPKVRLRPPCPAACLHLPPTEPCVAAMCMQVRFLTKIYHPNIDKVGRGSRAALLSVVVFQLPPAHALCSCRCVE